MMAETSPTTVLTKIESNPTMAGTVSATVRTVSTAAGEVPTEQTMTGTIPTMTGTQTTMAGTQPTMAGTQPTIPTSAVPATVRTVPTAPATVTGTVPAFTGTVPTMPETATIIAETGSTIPIDRENNQTESDYDIKFTDQTFISSASEGTPTTTSTPSLNGCISSPCRHEGQCSNIRNNYVCNCTGDYMGRHCEIGKYG
jgi:hypothetical protein